MNVAEIPSWWLVISGIFFFIVAILFVALCSLVYKLIGVISHLEPQVTSLVEKVNDLIPTVKSLVEKVETLTEKVEGIADSTRGTVDVVGTKAKSLATSVDHVASLAANGLQRYAPMLGALMAGVKLYGIFREFRGIRAKHEAEETGTPPVKKGILKARRGVEQSGSSSGS